MEQIMKLTSVVDDTVSTSSSRKTAVGIGSALLLMTLLAGASMPSMGNFWANLGIIGIFLLDVFVSIGIYRYHRPSNLKLAIWSSTLRLIYSAVLAVAIPFLFTEQNDVFRQIWGLGLIIFGCHLITLGPLFSYESGKKWFHRSIQSLLVLAGIGYVLTYVGIWFTPQPDHYKAGMEIVFMAPMILGEVLYAFWMLFKGGKSMANL